MSDVRTLTRLANKVRARVPNSPGFAHPAPAFMPLKAPPPVKAFDPRKIRGPVQQGRILTDACLVPDYCCCFSPPALLLPCHVAEKTPDIGYARVFDGTEIRRWGWVLQETDMPVGVSNPASVGKRNWPQGSTTFVPVNISA